MASDKNSGSLFSVIFYTLLALILLAVIYFIFFQSTGRFVFLTIKNMLGYKTSTQPSPSSLKNINESKDVSQCPNLLVREGNSLSLINTKLPQQPGVNPIKFNSLDDYIYYLNIQRTKYGVNCPVLYLQKETNAQAEDVYRVRPSPFDMNGGLPVVNETNPNNISSISNYFTGASSENIPSDFVNYPNNPSAFNFAAPPNATTPVRIPTPPSPPRIAVPYVDSSDDNKPFNQGQYAGFDPYGQFVGEYTNIDQIHDSTVSQNPQNGLSDNPMDPNWGGISFTHNQVASGKYDDNIVTRPIYSGAPNTTMIPDQIRPSVVAPPSKMSNSGSLNPLGKSIGATPANSAVFGESTRTMRSSVYNA